MKRKSVHIFAFCLFTFSLIVVPGCATWRAQPPLRMATAEQLRELLREREAAIRTMKGLFRAQIKAPGILIAQQVEGAVFYRRPDALRLRGFNRLGGELFEIVLGEDQYRLRLPTTGQVFAGRVTELDRIGQMGRPFQLSVWAVSGAVGIAPVSDRETVLLSEDGDRYRMDVWNPGDPDGGHAGAPIRRIWFERQSFQVVREDRLTPAGDVEATMRLEDFRPVEVSSTSEPLSPMSRVMADPMVKPFKISMQDGQGQGTLSLTFHEIVPNASLKPEELEPLQS